MQQVIKKFRSIHLLAIIILATTLFVACNNNDSKKDETPAEKPAAEQTTQPSAHDSMPTIDTSATSRPEPIKN